MLISYQYATSCRDTRTPTGPTEASPSLFLLGILIPNLLETFADETMELSRCLGIEADECARRLVVEELHDDAVFKALDRTVQRTELVQSFLFGFGEASPSEFLDDFLDLLFSIFRLDIVS